jgi:CheY-like chemotaxis protein
VFTCELPLPPVAEPEGKSSVAAPDESVAWLMRGRFSSESGEARHILLVEDNPVNALVAQTMLEHFGFSVTSVDNGADALDCLERHNVDLVLMDCEMPVMDGIETTRRIRERERLSGRPQVSIVALTANGFDVFVERCAPAGMNGHLIKPFRPQELAQVLTQHLPTGLCVS